MYLGGLDAGSSGCKITIYDTNGNFIESHYEPYDSLHTDSEHTIDFGEIAAAVEKVISATEHIPEALGVTSFGESFVLLDSDDNILNRSMLYNDSRGSEECLTFDRARTIAVAGTAPAPLYTLPKLKWMAAHRPELIEKARKICIIADYIVYILTGERALNYSAAARTMGFDVRKKCWDKELFECAGIDPALMPPLVPDGTIVGISNRFGLKNTKIISSMHDQNAAAVGAGALSPGDCVDGSGSVECLTPIISAIPESRSACEAGIAFMPFCDIYEGVAMSYTGGTAAKWVRSNFAPDESYKALDEAIGNEPGRLLLMPHLAGAATPYMDADSRGMIFGLTLGTTKYDLYRAVLEGVAYEMRVNLEVLAECGIKPVRLLATGGGAKSRVWTQIKSDITGLPITIADAPEVGALGLIMSAAKSLGIVSSLAEAKEIFTHEGETLLPDPTRKAVYDEQFEKYRRMYRLSKEIRFNAPR